MDEILDGERLTFLVLTHNGMVKIPVLLRILTRSLPLGARIVVVENGSTDGTAEYLDGCKDVHVVHTGVNLSPGAAFNRGLRVIDATSAVVRMDDDVIPFPNCIERIARIVRQPGVGVVGGTLYSCSGRLQHCGGASYHPRTGRDWCIDCFTDDLESGPRSWVSGACMAISPLARSRVPEFDERFPFWFEDIDYCFQIRESGLSVQLCRDAELYHLSDGDIDTRPIVRKSHDLFVEKWRSHRDAWDYIVPFE